MDTDTANTVTDKNSIDERAKEIINGSATFIVNNLLQGMTDKETVQLHLGEIIGKPIIDIGRKTLDNVDIATKEFVIQK